MAEDGIVAYGAVIGVMITLTIVLFAQRRKDHPEPLLKSFYSFQKRLQVQPFQKISYVLVVLIYLPVNIII